MTNDEWLAVHFRKCGSKVFLVILLLLLKSSAFAGDAVVIGYNADGVWTAVTYYCSSTPKGGSDYKDQAGARKKRWAI